MRKLTLLTIVLLLVGCASDQADSQTQSTTIFGRLSAYFQLGSTAESIIHKEQTESFYIYADAEVLMGRPAYVEVKVIDRETGLVRNDVQVDLELCHAVDPEIGGLGSCHTSYDGEIYHYELSSTFNDGIYRFDQFEWARPQFWGGEITITPLNGEPEVLETGAGVYPQRPPSTNLFELVSISLPFIVIAIFLLVIRLFRGQLMQSVNPTKLHGLTP